MFQTITVAIQVRIIFDTVRETFIHSAFHENNDDKTIFNHKSLQLQDMAATMAHYQFVCDMTSESVEESEFPLSPGNTGRYDRFNVVG